MTSQLRVCVLLVSVCLLIAACAGVAPTPAPATEAPSASSLSTPSPVPATSTTASGQKPVGLIAIGHSGMTGESSDPDRPGEDAPENSWATGTNPEVNSIYQRMVAARPETKEHVANLAEGGSVANKLASQAKQALQLVPAPELVLIQTIDNDIRCNGSDAQNLPAFGEAVARALKVITDASPNSKILMVSQPGRPTRFAAQVAANGEARAKFEGNGICDILNPDGGLNQEHIATLTGIIESYQAEQAKVCATVPQCRTDGGAFTTYQDNIHDLAVGDWNHLAIPGHTRLAEILWPVVAGILGLK